MQTAVSDAWLLHNGSWPPATHMEADIAAQILLKCTAQADQLAFEWRMLDAPSPRTLALCCLDPNNPSIPSDGIRYAMPEQITRVQLPLPPDHQLFRLLGPQVDLEMARNDVSSGAANIDELAQLVASKGFQPPKLDASGNVVVPSPDAVLCRTRKRFRLTRGPCPQLQIVWWGMEQTGPALPRDWAVQAIRAYPLPTPPSGAILPFRGHAAQLNHINAPRAPRQGPTAPVTAGATPMPYGQPPSAAGLPPQRGPPAISSYQQQQALLQQRAAKARAGGVPTNHMQAPASRPAHIQGEEHEQVADALDRISMRTLIASRYKAQHLDIAPVFDQWAVKDIILEYHKGAEQQKGEAVQSKVLDPEAEKARLREQLAKLQKDIAGIESKRRETKTSKS